MKRRIILAAPLGLAACGSVLPAQKYVAKVNWPLAPQPPVFHQGANGAPVLLVRPITAAPGLDAQGLQTIAPDGSLAIDYYNLWAVEPADAVTQSLVTWAQASGLFAAVVTPGSRLNADYIVEGELTELVADPSTAQARCVVTLVVIKTTGTPVPIRQQRLVGTAPLSGNDAAFQVTAERAALADVLGQAMAAIGAE
jgi:cholesterol transport system auxiliary component